MALGLCMLRSWEELPSLRDITHVDITPVALNVSVQDLNERLIFACIDGQTKPLEALITAGAQINEAMDTQYANSSALHCAAAGNNVKCVEKLLSLGADVRCLNFVSRMPPTITSMSECDERLSCAGVA